MYEYYEVLYDAEPGFCSYSKSFPVGEDGKDAAKARAEQEAKRLENIGYYIYDIQFHDPRAIMEAMMYGFDDDEEEEEEID